MKITRGVEHKPVKVLIYGPEGIGKTTFASQFPEPVFIDTEGSTARMNVARLPKPNNWTELLEEVWWVIREKPCKTLVIDTLDWAEKLEIQDLLERNGKKSIEAFGYGKGYIMSAEEIQNFLHILDKVIEAGMHVVLTAHAQIRKFEQPDEMGAYDRYELKLGNKTGSRTSPIVKEWADMVLFANYKTYAIKDGNKVKATGGKRVMYTSHHPCWDAKNRFGLPEEMEFDYANIKHCIEDDNTDAVATTEELGPFSKHEINVTDGLMDGPAIVSNEDINKLQDEYAREVYKPIDSELVELMKYNHVKAEDLQLAVLKEGYVDDVNFPIQDYPKEFIDYLKENWSEWTEKIYQATK